MKTGMLLFFCGKMGAAKNVESAGADFLLICTNTMHKRPLSMQ